MITNILVMALDFLLEPAHIEDESKYGTVETVGTVYGKEAELITHYDKGAGFVEGTIGETKFRADFDESINRHSFKLSVDGKPPFIVDREELLLIARDHF
jgi:hypothetical protein